MRVHLDRDIEYEIHDYIITQYALKAVTRDQHRLSDLKLGKVWGRWMDSVSRHVEAEHLQARKRLKRRQCKIVANEITAQRMVHIMYVYKGYEHHCYMAPAVLKGKCEELLQSLLQSKMASKSFPGQPHISTK